MNGENKRGVSLGPSEKRPRTKDDDEDDGRKRKRRRRMGHDAIHIQNRRRRYASH
jgi:hypothetical protein